jgi:hypothetical protein
VEPLALGADRGAVCIDHGFPAVGMDAADSLGRIALPRVSLSA